MRHVRRGVARPAAAALVSVAVAVAAVVIADPAAARTVPRGASWYSTYQLPAAWKVSEGAGVTVAVLDSRIKTAVGDLRGRTLTPVDLPGANPDYVTATGYSHGTDMAVKIAGSGTGAGMVGVAPRAQILPIDIGAESSSGADPDLAATAIRTAVDRGAKVINMSFGGATACYPPEAAAIRYAYQRGVIVVAAAGDSPGPVSSPANCPGALAVGGVDATGKPWTRTPSGPEIDFVSQSYDLVNEQLNGTLGGPYPGNDGTSSAAAFVSGMFALLIAHFPHDSTRRIVARALYWTHTGRGAAGIDKRIDNYLGYGELLPYQALTGTTPATAPNPIFDAFDNELGLGAGAPPSSSSSSTAPGSASTAPTGPVPAAVDHSTDNSAHNAAVIGGIVGFIVVLVAIALFVTLRRRGRGGPPPPSYPGYPPPGASAQGWTGH